MNFTIYALLPFVPTATINVYVYYNFVAPPTFCACVEVIPSILPGKFGAPPHIVMRHNYNACVVSISTRVSHPEDNKKHGASS